MSLFPREFVWFEATSTLVGPGSCLTALFLLSFSQCLKYLQSKLGNNFPFCQCLLFSVLNECSLQTAKANWTTTISAEKTFCLAKAHLLVYATSPARGPEPGEILAFSLTARCRSEKFLFWFGEDGDDIWRAHFTLLTDTIFLGTEMQRMSSSEKSGGLPKVTVRVLNRFIPPHPCHVGSDHRPTFEIPGEFNFLSDICDLIQSKDWDLNSVLYDSMPLLDYLLCAKYAIQPLLGMRHWKKCSKNTLKRNFKTFHESALFEQSITYP